MRKPEISKRFYKGILTVEKHGGTYKWHIPDWRIHFTSIYETPGAIYVPGAYTAFCVKIVFGVYPGS